MIDISPFTTFQKAAYTGHPRIVLVGLEEAAVPVELPASPIHGPELVADELLVLLAPALLLEENRPPGIDLDG
jgi:hypothetical protein